MTRACDQCGKYLITQRQGARFCDERCRAEWHNSKRRHLDPEPVTQDSPTTLYRLFDAGGSLLYVGVTSGHPVARFKAHGRIQWWWGSVTSATMEHFATRSEALSAEARAIRSEMPSQNQAGVVAA